MAWKRQHDISDAAWLNMMAAGLNDPTSTQVIINKDAPTIVENFDRGFVLENPYDTRSKSTPQIWLGVNEFDKIQQTFGAER